MGETRSKFTIKRMVTEKSRNKELPQVLLTSPTSVSMKNSFLIKIGDGPIKRRKTAANSGEATYGRIRGKRPGPRDGHTGVMWQNYFIVFGGDRHHMPFNDLFYLDMQACTETIAST